MGKVLPDDLAFEDEEEVDLDLPTDTSPSGEELLGTSDAEDLVLAEIGGGPEDVGLDAETNADAAGSDLLDELQLPDEEDARVRLDERGLEIEPELDLGDEDDEGWTDDTLGTGAEPDEDLGLEDEDEPSEDGGLEGVDDLELDGLSGESVGDDDAFEAPRALEGDDEDDALLERELEDELLSDFAA